MIALILLLAVGPATAAQSAAGTGSSGSPAARTYELTLPTGERVALTSFADGRQSATLSGGESGGGVATYEEGGDLFVVPDDVADLIPDELDPALFDVTELVREGFDDGSTSSLPLIVTYQAAPISVPAVQPVEPLPSINGAGAKEDKARARELGHAIAGLQQTNNAAGPSGFSTSPELAGLKKIWLDRRVTSADEVSMPQIGASVAWAAGLSGKGVPVAVLDTGIDTSHPDLFNKVVAARNFTSSDATDTADRFGHGTHVASIIAGNGAASNGLRKGVAYGAPLINGKVLGDSGSGLLSWVIAGMQWAAGVEHAKVINLSLGSTPSDGSGPQDQAINSLTAQYGTLFVVAAGNSGRPRTVSSPGSADAALAVGAVDASNALAPFSSQGPRVGDLAIKPEITAPGVNIIAARAAGSALAQHFPPIDNAYVALSGTSMATPHVAGAAAVLLEKYTALTPIQLKAMLVSTAASSNGYTVYQQGGGRVDLGHAISSSAFASPATISFGFFKWPHDTRLPISRSVTYVNLSNQPLTLDLAVDVRDEDGHPAASGMVSLPTSQLVVPPNGSTPADVILDTRLGTPALYGGYVTARDQSGTTVLHTPIGFYKEPEMHKVTLQAITRQGNPASNPSFASLLNVDDKRAFSAPLLVFSGLRGGKTRTLRVPVGNYSVTGIVFTPAADAFDRLYNNAQNEAAIVSNPEFRVTQDMTLLLDARTSRQVKVKTADRETDTAAPGAAVALGYSRSAVVGGTIAIRYLPAYGDGIVDNQVFEPASASVASGSLETYTRWRLQAPDIKMSVSLPSPLMLHPEYLYRGAWPLVEQPRLFGNLMLPLVDANMGRVQDFTTLDAAGKVAIVQWSDTVSIFDQAANAAAAGAAGILVYSNYPGSRLASAFGYAPGYQGNFRYPIPALRLSHEEGQQLLGVLAQGPVTLAIDGRPNSPYLYDLIFAEPGPTATASVYSVADSQLAKLDNAYYAQKPGQVLGEARAFWRPSETVSGSWLAAIHGIPRTRSEFISPGDTTWQENTWTDFGFGSLVEGLNRYTGAQTANGTWWKQPLRPGFVEGTQFGIPIPVSRTGNTLLLVIPQFEDADGHLGAQYPISTPTVFRLYRDGQLIHTEPNLPNSLVDVPPDAAHYRLEMDVDSRPAVRPWPSPQTHTFNDWATMSIETNTAWGFTSQRPAAGTVQVLPLLVVDYDLNLDLLNRSQFPNAQGGANVIDLRARHQAGEPSIPITDLTLSVSYDDGQTWKKVENLKPLGDGAFRAILDERSPQSTNGFVSLQVHAVDAEANTFDQRILRAYAIADRPQ